MSKKKMFGAFAIPNPSGSDIFAVSGEIGGTRKFDFAVCTCYISPDFKAF